MIRIRKDTKKVKELGIRYGYSKSTIWAFHGVKGSMIYTRGYEEYMK